MTFLLLKCNKNRLKQMLKQIKHRNRRKNKKNKSILLILGFPYKKTTSLKMAKKFQIQVKIPDDNQHQYKK